VIRGEELGFDSVWLGTPQASKITTGLPPLMVLAGYATRTTRILLGTDVLVLPFYHPVRIAEDAAMLGRDLHGRFILGAASATAPTNLPCTKRRWNGAAHVLPNSHFDPALVVGRQRVLRRDTLSRRECAYRTKTHFHPPAYHSGWAVGRPFASNGRLKLAMRGFRGRLPALTSCSGTSDLSAVPARRRQKPGQISRTR